MDLLPGKKGKESMGYDGYGLGRKMLRNSVLNDERTAHWIGLKVGNSMEFNAVLSWDWTNTLVRLRRSKLRKFVAGSHANRKN